MLALLLALGVICSAYDAAAEPATSDGGGGLEYLTNMGAFTPPGGFQAVEDRQEELARRSSELAAAHDMLEGKFTEGAGLHELLGKMGLDLASERVGGKKRGRGGGTGLMDALLPSLQSGMLKSPGDVLSSKALRDLNFGGGAPASAVDGRGCAMYDVEDILPVQLNQHAPHEPDHVVYDHAAALLQLYGVAVIDSFFGPAVSDDVASGAHVLRQHRLLSRSDGAQETRGVWYHGIEGDWANHEHPHVHSILDHRIDMEVIRHRLNKRWPEHLHTHDVGATAVGVSESLLEAALPKEQVLVHRGCPERNAGSGRTVYHVRSACDVVDRKRSVADHGNHSPLEVLYFAGDNSSCTVAGQGGNLTVRIPLLEEGAHKELRVPEECMLENRTIDVRIPLFPDRLVMVLSDRVDYNISASRGSCQLAHLATIVT